MHEGVVGQFRSGHTTGNLPESLPNWRVVTDSPETARGVSQVMGGQPREQDGKHSLEVLTSSSRVDITLTGPTALRREMKLWRRSRLAHHCDGATFLGPTEVRGDPCGCPSLMGKKKAEAKAFRGPQPVTTLRFLLTAAPHLGLFYLQSTSWKLAEDVPEIAEDLRSLEGHALAELRVELVQFTTIRGSSVAYRRPVIRVLV
ncbi:recombination directionality factor [Streptomyces albireticuli]|uniref:recombination directionality factor n=1 Tax=Streptomyces albireticuli TaxID=1940 RepID=UPI003676E4EC